LCQVNTSAVDAGGGALVLTVRVVVPLTAPEVALIVDVPAVTAEATPAVLMGATAAFDDDHVAVLVRFCVELSLKEPVAVNC
jgi:ABC-type spermidine/putrescine transport system permease subunit I